MAALAVTLHGCFLFDQSSATRLGVVEVSAVRVSDTCGPGLDTGGAAVTYSVELSVSGSTLTWAGPAGRAQGRYDGAGGFCIELAGTWHVRDADPWYGDPGCDMVSLERLCGTVEVTEEESPAGTVDTRAAGLSARHETFLAPADGSYCPELIGLSAGQFLALPCGVAYELTGTPSDL